MAANLAMRRLGDPLKTREQAVARTLEDAAQQVEATTADLDVHPRLVGDLSSLAVEDLVGVLKDLVSASEEISWANLERRGPLLPGWFKTYDRRAGVAKIIGTELHRRGGMALMKRVPYCRL